jgi:beta-xylosidase
MNKTLLCFAALFLIIACVVPTRYALGADSTKMAHNPILWADVPDIAMVRVGDTYYMSSTTMHMSPGLPIMKSKDLVNWKIASYAYETLADTNELNLTDGKNDYGKGSWASSLRYHNGTFYATTFSLSTGKTYIYSTKSPNETPWKAISSMRMFGDHSLFFDDDGRVYMVYGNGDIRVTELKSDLTDVKPGGVDQLIIPNASAVAGGTVGLPAEGSQIFKINGYYYLCNITWPKNDMRTEIIHRATAITGPYEGRVLFHFEGIAQGGLIDTPKGEWYAYLFQDHGAVGRTPFLVPVKWVDGWPVLGDDGKAPETLNILASKVDIPGIVASDEFERKPGDRPLPLVWQWNHNPDNANWSLTARPGSLRLTCGRVDTELTQARNTLTQRTFGPESSATTAIDVTHMKDGDYAGLVAFQRKYGFVGVKELGGASSIVMVSAQSDKPEELASIPFNQKTVFLRVDCDFKERTDKAYFYYSLNGEDWSAIGEPLQMVYTFPHFMGYRFGLFNFATKTAGGFVDFDYMRLSDKIIAVP